MNELPLNQILCGDCVEVLKDFPDDSIDLVVTDPPYGLSFMGKDWDKALPVREAFEQIIRVLKPGALAFVMSSPRQDLLWRMLALLEGVGFELTQSYIDWIYKTGFPKAYDVSKGIDRRNERTQEDFQELAKFLRDRRMELGLNQKDIAKHFPSKTGGLTGCVANWELGYNIPTKEQWDLLKNLLEISTPCFDEIINRLEAEREKTGIDKNWGEKGIVPLTGYGEWEITKPALELSEKWDGWKSQTGLKPAHEPILMVNKPFSEKTIIDNVLRWGTGAINVDVCRIPFSTQDTEEYIPNRVGFKDGINHVAKKKGDYKDTPTQGIFAGDAKELKIFNQKGRFPANLLVSDRALDTGEMTTASHRGVSRKGKEPYPDEDGWIKRRVFDSEIMGYPDSGGASRYFDLDAWAEHHGLLDVPKPDNKERDYGLKGRKAVPKSKFNLNDGSKDERFDGAISLPRRNTHPTVKPIKLMAYLIELGCPPDGVVLDPFVGSGTTCIAAKKLVRKYVGIEINPEYVALAEARIRAYPIPFDWFNESVGVPPKSRLEE